MSTAFDGDWAAGVCSVCDPVFRSADVGFVRQMPRESGRVLISSLLWEADPLRFAERYPDSGIVESYGLDQWPPPCIDYWVYVDAKSREGRISVEGWNSGDQIVSLTGVGLCDGLALGEVVAAILCVPLPC